MWHALPLAAGGYGTLVAHELAHLCAARGSATMAVTIGLGPAIAEFTDLSGTVWAFKLLPLRSACGFFDGPHPQTRLSRTDAKPRATFRSLPLGKRAVILVAGPLSNAALACILIFATYAPDADFTLVRLGKAGSGITYLICSPLVAIALFNFLPIPPLDGGRLAIPAFEAFTGNPIETESEKRLFRLGVVLLSVMTFFGALLFLATPSLVFE